MKSDEFCQALTDMGLQLTGTFRTEMSKGNLTTKTAVFRALLKPVLDDFDPNHIAGQVLPRGEDTVDSVRPLELSLPPPSWVSFGGCCGHGLTIFRCTATGLVRPAQDPRD